MGAQGKGEGVRRKGWGEAPHTSGLPGTGLVSQQAQEPPEQRLLRRPLWAPGWGRSHGGRPSGWLLLPEPCSAWPCPPAPSPPGTRVGGTEEARGLGGWGPRPAGACGRPEPWGAHGGNFVEACRRGTAGQGCAPEGPGCLCGRAVSVRPAGSRSPRLDVCLCLPGCAAVCLSGQRLPLCAAPSPVRLASLQSLSLCLCTRPSLCARVPGCMGPCASLCPRGRAASSPWVCLYSSVSVFVSLFLPAVPDSEGLCPRLRPRLSGPRRAPVGEAPYLSGARGAPAEGPGPRDAGRRLRLGAGGRGAAGGGQGRRPLPRPSPSAAQPPPAAPAAARPGRPLPRAVCGERAPPPPGAAPPPRPRPLAGSLARRRSGGGGGPGVGFGWARLCSATLGWARLGSAGLGQARQGSAGSKNSEEPRLLGGRRPAACRGRSHPRTAAAIQLAGRARRPCHWSCAGVGTGPPFVQAGAGAGGGLRGLLCLDPSRGKGAGARPIYSRRALAPATPGRAAHLTSEKSQSLCTPIPEGTAPHVCKRSLSLSCGGRLWVPASGRRQNLLLLEAPCTPARPLSPGCGPCIYTSEGLQLSPHSLAPGGVSSSAHASSLDTFMELPPRTGCGFVLCSAMREPRTERNGVL